MKRIKDEFLPELLKVVDLRGRKVLEIGCGDGVRSEAIATECRELVGIDPDGNKVDAANRRHIRDAYFLVGGAENLQFGDNEFDVVIFTLSLHHVPEPLMARAIDEAVRVVRQGAYIVFLEPGTEGSFFEAEIKFNACDGDERQAKAAAYDAMLNYPKLRGVAEIADETVFTVDSVTDFVKSMSPKQALVDIESFLWNCNWTLNASRRINIFTAKK